MSDDPSPRRGTAVVFDLDGVLVQTEHVNIASAFAAFRALGHELDPADEAAIVGRHPADYVPAMADRFGLSETDRERLKEIQNRHYMETWDREVRLTDGVVEALTALRDDGCRIGLATSAGRVHAGRCLERFDLIAYFEIVLTKDDVDRRKPDPLIYLESARRMGVAPEDLVVVEDSRHGIAAAKAAGARCIAVRTETTPADALREADVVIESLTELRGVVVS